MDYLFSPFTSSHHCTPVPIHKSLGFFPIHHSRIAIWPSTRPRRRQLSACISDHAKQHLDADWAPPPAPLAKCKIETRAYSEMWSELWRAEIKIPAVVNWQLINANYHLKWKKRVGDNGQENQQHVLGCLKIYYAGCCTRICGKELYASLVKVSSSLICKESTHKYTHRGTILHYCFKWVKAWHLFSQH